MNRIPTWTKLAAETPESSLPLTVPAVEHALLQRRVDGDIHYSLFSPLHYEKNYAYPLVVWLHGPDDDERQLQRVMPHISMRNYVGVGPRASCRSRTQQRGFNWCQSSQCVAETEQAVFSSVAVAQSKLNISSRRIFLAGFQCGGTMAFRIALRHPRQFAGVLSIGGLFPNGDSPLANLDSARDLPLFIASGRDSQLYSIDQTCRDLRLFHSAGMSVTLRQYPCGDELNTQMLRDMDIWMMELVTGVPASTDDEATWQGGEWN